MRWVNFAPVDATEVLSRVVSLPVQSWNYKAQPGDKHIGPVAQDFHEAFGLNGKDDTHIATVDEAGVALAAIQGLNQKLEQTLQQKETEITELKRRLLGHRRAHPNAWRAAALHRAHQRERARLLAVARHGLCIGSDQRFGVAACRHIMVASGFSLPDQRRANLPHRADAEREQILSAAQTVIATALLKGKF